MGRPSQRPRPIKHRWLDQWLAADGEPLRKLVEATRGFLEHDEQYEKTRQRKRRSLDETHYRDSVEVIVANAALAVIDPPESGRIAVTASQGVKGRTRYDNPALGSKPLRSLLYRLDRLEFLEFQMPKAIRGERSSFAPTDWFKDKVKEFGVSMDDFGWRGGEVPSLVVLEFA